MTAVEYDDFSLGRCPFVNAPEVVVSEFTGRRLIEARHVHGLRIDAAEDMPDGPILSARIHALEHKEQLLASIHEEALLEVRQFFVQAGQFLDCCILAAGQVVPRIRGNFSELHILARLNEVVIIVTDAHK